MVNPFNKSSLKASADFIKGKLDGGAKA